MTKTTIVFVGTTHVSDKSKQVIEHLVKKYKFDVFLLEGVKKKGAYNFKNLIREPLFLIFTFILFLFLEYFSKDMSTAKRIAKENRIPVYNIDETLTNLISEGHKWYNYLLFLCPFSFFIFIYIQSGVGIITLIFLAIVLSIILCVLYSGWFILHNINKKREMVFINKIVKRLKNRKYKTVLVVTGKYHKNIKNHLISEGFRVVYTQ